MAEHAQYFATKQQANLAKLKTVVRKTLIYLFLTIFALFMLTPFAFMVVASFIDADAFADFTQYADFTKLGFQNWTIANYQQILNSVYVDNLGNVKQGANFFQYYLNTLIVAVGSTSVTVITAVLAAFVNVVLDKLKLVTAVPLLFFCD